MQLSAPLPPFDLSAALPTSPAVGVAAGPPSGDVADFNALLSAQVAVATPASAASNPLAPVVVLPEAEPDATSDQPTFGGEGGESEPDVTEDSPAVLPDTPPTSATPPQVTAPMLAELGVGAAAVDFGPQDAATKNSEDTISPEEGAAPTHLAGAEKSAGVARQPAEFAEAAGGTRTEPAAAPRAQGRGLSRRGATDAGPAVSAEFSARSVVSRAKDAVSNDASTAPQQTTSTPPNNAEDAVRKEIGRGPNRGERDVPPPQPLMPRASMDVSREELPLERMSSAKVLDAAATPAPVAPSAMRDAAAAVTQPTSHPVRPEMTPAQVETAPSSPRDSRASAVTLPTSDAKTTEPAATAEGTDTAGSRIENFDTPRAGRSTASADVAAPVVATRRDAMEKIAVSSPRAAAVQVAAYKSVEKTSEVANKERVDGLDEVVGTNVANPERHMPSAAPHVTSAPHAIERLSQAVAPLSFDVAPGEEAGEGIELSQAARRAVEAAVTVTEKFAAEGKPAVTLKFTVSGVDLGVRVELRGENVHTTFRTDSPELRAALAQEWHNVAAAHSADRNARLAEPVFTSQAASNSTSGSANNSSGSDFGAADQRGSQQRQEQGATDEWARYRALPRSADVAPARSSASVTAPRTTVSSTPGRLHTFA